MTEVEGIRFCFGKSFKQSGHSFVIAKEAVKKSELLLFNCKVLFCIFKKALKFWHSANLF